MKHKWVLITLLAFATTAKGQETAEASTISIGQEATEALPTLAADTTLHLPVLNSLGQVPYMDTWPMSYSFLGYGDWRLHSGMNLSVGASVFASFGKHAPKGAGFAQDIVGMYAVPLTPKLSLAAGGYFLNADWGGMNVRDAGASGVLGYQFNERWEGYLYGQKSLVEPRTPWPLYPMQEVGDRIGAAIKYNITPQFSINLSIEDRKKPSGPPIPPVRQRDKK